MGQNILLYRLKLYILFLITSRARRIILFISNYFRVFSFQDFKGTSQANIDSLSKSCVDPESFVRGGPTWTGFFWWFSLVDEGRKDPNTTVGGPSLACRCWPNIECSLIA